MSAKNTQNWLSMFIEKNAWSIIAFIVIFTISYTTLATRIDAQDNRIDKLEEAFLIQAQNQRDIIILQQQQKTNDDNIKIIREDIKEIKKALNIF